MWTKYAEYDNAANGYEFIALFHPDPDKTECILGLCGDRILMVEVMEAEKSYKFLKWQVKIEEFGI